MRAYFIFFSACTRYFSPCKQQQQNQAEDYSYFFSKWIENWLNMNNKIIIQQLLSYAWYKHTKRFHVWLNQLLNWNRKANNIKCNVKSIHIKLMLATLPRNTYVIALEFHTHVMNITSRYVRYPILTFVCE